MAAAAAAVHLRATLLLHVQAAQLAPRFPARALLAARVYLGAGVAQTRVAVPTGRAMAARIRAVVARRVLARARLRANVHRAATARCTPQPMLTRRAPGLLLGGAVAVTFPARVLWGGVAAVGASTAAVVATSLRVAATTALLAAAEAPMQRLVLCAVRSLLLVMPEGSRDFPASMAAYPLSALLKMQEVRRPLQLPPRHRLPL